MLAGLYDRGGQEPATRPLQGHSLAVYEPDARLSLVWPVEDEPEEERRHQDWERLPEWAETGPPFFKWARQGWAVVLLGGAPIWQQSMLYLDWGSGIGGYVADFQPVFGERRLEDGQELLGWTTSQWAVGVVGLINSFSHTAADFARVDPTRSLVPQPDATPPVDAHQAHY